MLLVELAPRFREAQLWWVAATLARRHPELALVESVRPPGATDCLSALHGSQWVASLDRAGYLYVGGLAGCGAEMAFESGDPDRIVTFIEEASGLRPPGGMPAATARSLVYRVASALMLMSANDPVRLDVRGELTAGADGPERSQALPLFPAAAERAREHRKDDPLDEPLHRYWLVRRGDEAVAVLDTDGYAYVGDQEFALPQLYARNGRKVVGLLHECFGELLA